MDINRQYTIEELYSAKELFIQIGGSGERLKNRAETLMYTFTKILVEGVEVLPDPERIISLGACIIDCKYRLYTK